MMEDKPFNAKEEIEKLCEKHNIFFTTKGNLTHENLIAVGLGNILYSKLSEFVKEKKSNGFYILQIRNPDTKQEYNIEIKYEGGEEPDKEKIETLGITQQEILSFISMRQEDLATERAVNYIKNNYYFDSIRQDKISEIWIYDEGIRKPNGESAIKEICRTLFAKSYTPQRVNKIIAKIEADTFIDADKFFKKEEENKWEVATKSGILNLKTRVITPFTPDKYFFNKINVIYNPNAKCPEIYKFLSEVLKNKEDVKVAFELFGWILFRRYFIQTAIMLLGDGENGKGVFGNLMRNFVGIESCCSVPLSQLTSDSFSCSELFGKSLNLAGDISNEDLKDTSRFKELTSGTDLITAKRKFQKDLFFENYAKLIFSCNELPRVYDFTHGFWRRWLILEFIYTFLKESEYNLKEDKTNIKIADPEILIKITTPEELSGLLNEALNGLKRLLEKKQFSYTKSTAEVKELWIRKSDSFTSFCMDCLEEDVEGIVTKKIIRKKFSEYCKMYGIKGSSDKSIKATLENMFGVVEGKKGWGESEERVWEGIKLKQSQERRGILPYSQTTNSVIGINTMPFMTLLENEKNYNKKSQERQGFLEKDLNLNNLTPEEFELLYKIEESYKPLQQKDIEIPESQEYEDFGEVDFEDHQIEEAEKQYEKDRDYFYKNLRLNEDEQ